MPSTPTHFISKESHTCESFVSKRAKSPLEQGPDGETSVPVFVWLGLFVRSFCFFTSLFLKCKGRKWKDGGLKASGGGNPRKRRKNDRRNKEM